MAQIGIQLYSLREETKTDFFGTIARVAKAGYHGVEHAGYFGTPAPVLKQFLDDQGLVTAGSHLGFALLDKELDAQLAYCQQIACPAVIVPWVPAELRPDADGWKRVAASFNQFGAACKQHGMKFLYHQHGYEFQKFDGKTGQEILAENTDPALVGFEPDVYWIERNGVDAVQFLLTYGDRSPYIHVKDAGNRDDWQDTEAGAGVIDMVGVFHEAKKNKAEWYILEQEHFDRPSMESIAISFKNMQKLLASA